jgi:hypothetical protein
MSALRLISKPTWYHAGFLLQAPIPRPPERIQHVAKEKKFANRVNGLLWRWRSYRRRGHRRNLTTGRPNRDPREAPGTRRILRSASFLLIPIE